MHYIYNKKRIKLILFFEVSVWLWRISWTMSAKKAVSSKAVELIYGSKNAMSYGKLEKLEKAGKLST